jgi:hypothetical protein
VADGGSTALRIGEMVRDRGTDLSAERRTGKDGDEMVDQHLEMIRDVTPSADGCEDCLRIGSRWVHLRLCLTCGHVGRCDSSPHRHARMHFYESGHPIICKSWDLRFQALSREIATRHSGHGGEYNARHGMNGEI